MKITGWLNIPACQSIGTQLRMVPVPGGMLFRALGAVQSADAQSMDGVTIALQFIPCSIDDRDLFIKENCSSSDGLL